MEHLEGGEVWGGIMDKVIVRKPCGCRISFDYLGLPKIERLCLRHLVEVVWALKSKKLEKQRGSPGDGIRIYTEETLRVNSRQKVI